MGYIQGWENGPADDLTADRYAEALIDTKQDMLEVLTQDIRTTDVNKLGLRYVKSNSFGGTQIAMYPVTEVLTDYGTDTRSYVKGIKSPMDALLDVLAKSDCPLVQAYRVALAERYADAWAGDVVEAMQ